MRLARFPPAAIGLFVLVALPVFALSGWATSGPEGVRAIAVSAPADDNARAYAAAAILESSTSALYRTDDGGQSWTALVEAPRGDSYSQVFADPRNGGRVFAAAQQGSGTTNIYRSLDLGDNWSSVLTISTRCVPSFATGASADSLLFTCGTRFLRTNDAGLTWEEPATPFAENVRLAPASGGILYAYGLAHIFRSADEGTTWTPSGSAPSACPGLLALRVDPGNPATFLAGTGVVGTGGFQCGGVYRSTNSGVAWAAAGLSGVYVTDLASPARDPARIYACASFLPGILPPGGVFLSTDGGASFSSLDLPTTGALEVAISAIGNIVHAATPAGVYELGGRRPRVVAPR